VGWCVVCGVVWGGVGGEGVDVGFDRVWSLKGRRVDDGESALQG